MKKLFAILFVLLSLQVHAATNTFDMATRQWVTQYIAFVFGTNAGWGGGGTNNSGGGPITIDYFTNSSSSVELGTATSNVLLGWHLSGGTPVTLNINLLGNLATNVTSAVDTNTYTTNTTWTLTAANGFGSVNKSTTINFQQKRFWGVSTNANLTASAEILALNNEFASDRLQTKTFNPVNQYIYFSYPTNFGAASFYENGFPEATWPSTNVAFVNASGSTNSYYVYRSFYYIVGGTYTVEIR